MIRQPKHPGGAERIDLLFHSVLTRLFSIPARQPASGNVTFAQMRVLWVLETTDARTLGEVAARLGISRPSATEVVDRLSRGGYLKRERSAEDRREVNLQLTARGRSMMDEFSRKRRERFDKLLTVISRRDVADMVASLERLNRILEKWKGASA